MDILNNKLNSIIKNSRINFYQTEIIEELKKRKINVDILGEINDIWNKIDKTSKVAIYGAGNHTIRLFEIVDRRDKNIVCIVDNLKHEGNFIGYPLINKDKLKEYDIDTVFISTLGYAKEIKEEVIKEFPNLVIIDMYSELQKRGYDITKPFYYSKDAEIYTSIYEIHRMYELYGCEKYLSNLIYRYINIKDFYFAKKYIEEYITKNYKQSELFKILEKNIDKFINDIKNKLLKSKEKNGLIILIDALRFKDIKNYDNMKFIKELGSKYITCDYAYTHVPYTSMSILSMITEKKLMDNDLISIDFPIKHQGLLGRIDKLNYKFKYYGNQVQFFDESCLNKGEHNNISELLWNYVCDKCYSTKNISIVHIMEAHSPYIGGMHKNKPMNFEPYGSKYLEKDEVDKMKQQRGEALDYIDKQINYYFDFISKDTSIIITSDHGNILEYDMKGENDNFYTEDSIHIPYIIIDDNISVKQEDRLISHLDTGKIICNLIQKNLPFFNVDERAFIEVHRDFTYSKFHLEKLIKIDKMYLGKAFKCFRSKNEKYIISYDKKEEFYIMPNEDENFINNNDYKIRISEIKGKVNYQLPNFNEERFRYARKIFKPAN